MGTMHISNPLHIYGDNKLSNKKRDGCITNLTNYKE